MVQGKKQLNSKPKFAEVVIGDNEAGNHRQLTIVRPGVVFGKGENGNFTRLYWAIRGHKFAYPGRKDTIKGKSPLARMAVPI